MDEQCPSQRELLIRRRLFWLVLPCLVLFGAWQAWQITQLQRSRNEAIQERINQAARAEYVVDSAPVAMILCDADANITAFNPAAEHIFGYTAKELKGTPIHQLVGSSHSATHVAAFHAAVERLKATSGNWQISCRVQGMARHKSGQEFPAVIAVRGIKYSGYVEFLAVVQPVSQERPEISRMTVPPPPQQSVSQKAEAAK